MTGHTSINKFLLPFSFIYGLIVGIRNKFFDWKILPTEEFPIPIITIGNISVGGTGKTPHTEYLIHMLNKKMKVAVLSRGYKRKTSGFIIADKNSNSRTIGDEPYQMYRKFPGIIVAVDGNRRRGIKKLLSLPEEQKPEIILLDDAFQHRYVTPTLSILLIDSNHMIYNDALLPAGRLREKVSSKSRAGMVIVTKCPEEFKPIDYRIILRNLKLYPYQSLFFTSFKYGNLIPIFNTNGLKEIKLDDLKKDKISVLLVAGIASPKGFIDEIKNYSQEVETLIFPDHHNFSTKDLNKISNSFDKIRNENKIILSTEKDAVRLIDDPQLDEKIKQKIYYLPIEVFFKLDQEDLFKQKIEKHVKNTKRNSNMA